MKYLKNKNQNVDSRLLYIYKMAKTAQLLIISFIKDGQSY